jgi:hypothetical protein
LSGIRPPGSDEGEALPRNTAPLQGIKRFEAPAVGSIADRDDARPTEYPRGTTEMVSARNRTIALLCILVLALIAGGCDWYGLDEVDIRPLPYPYDAGVAIDAGDAPRCLSAHGVTFFYDGEEVRTAGQDAACSLVDRGRQLWETLVFLVSRREWRANSFFANRLFEPRVSDSGSVAYAYKRYAGSVARLPSHMPADVAAQIAETLAYEIMAKGGVMIIEAQSTDPKGPLGAALDHLRAQHSDGSIYLTECDQILAYGYLRRYLDWDATNTDDSVTIHVHAVHDTLAEPWVPTLDELDGLTFYTPDPERTRVTLGGSEVHTLTVNAPDRMRRGSVTIRGADALSGDRAETPPGPGASSSRGGDPSGGSVSPE